MSAGKNEQKKTRMKRVFCDTQFDSLVKSQKRCTFYRVFSNLRSSKRRSRGFPRKRQLPGLST